MEKCTKFFTFLCDGLSGSELLGLALVICMIGLVGYVQLKETGTSKNIDFSWLFLDQVSGKVSRSGVMLFGGFLLGCWAIVDAEQSGHLDWAFFGTFLSYCAGVRAIEAFKPRVDPDKAPDFDYLKDYRHERTSVDSSDCSPSGSVRPSAPGQTRE